ncbi:MAG: hypothetical protein U9N31_08375, partial [Candidatus Marinimicrobia bacterium]|nr:hypothetical protein [Candidatus Neomarinimicrobiota bacterium]
MNPRKIFLPFLTLFSVLFGGESVINLKTFPRPTMDAVIATGEIIIDGHVNEAAWMAADSITEFYQSQPNPGYPATERTVVRLLYDKEFLYVSAVLYD